MKKRFTEILIYVFAAMHLASWGSLALADNVNPAGAPGGNTGGGGGGGVSSVSGTSGRITSSGGTTPVIDLAPSGAAAGSYTLPNVTVDTYGRITGISSGAGASYATYSPTQYPHLRPALAAVKAGTGFARIDIDGDSTTGAAGSSGNVRYTFSVPAILQGIFRAAGIPSAEGFVVPNFTDDRWTLGSDWSASNAGVGNSNSAYTAASGTTNLTFAPGHNFTNLDVYVLKGAGLGTFQVDIDGGSIGTVNCTTGGTGVGTVACYSFTGISNANHTIAFHAPGGTGAVTIVGVEVWDNNVKSVLISNMGLNGTTTSNWTSTGSGDVIKTRIAKGVHCMIVNLGINDAVNASPGASIGPFNSNMATITGFMAGADIVLQTAVPSNPAYSAGAAPNEVAQAASVISMTQVNNWGLIDIGSRFVSFTVSNAVGLYQDDLHPSIPLGYNDIAQGYFDAIGKYNGPFAVNTITSPGASINVSQPAGAVQLDLPTQSGVAGNFTNANVTVNSKGIITAISSGAGGSGSGQVFPAFNVASTRTIWNLMNSSYGGTNLVMTPAVLFNKTGTESLAFADMSDRFTSAASIGAQAGLTSGGVMTYFNQQPQQFIKAWTGNIVNCRYWIGMSGGNEAGNATPSTASAMFGYDTAVDGTAFWRIVTCNGTSTTRQATTVPIVANTEYQFAIDDSVPGSVVFYINGSPVGTLNTNLPTGANAVTIQCTVTALTASAQLIEFRHAWVNSL